MGMDQYLLIPFLVGWTSINHSYFDVNKKGVLWVLTLPNHIKSIRNQRAKAHIHLEHWPRCIDSLQLVSMMEPPPPPQPWRFTLSQARHVTETCADDVRSPDVIRDVLVEKKTYGLAMENPQNKWRFRSLGKSSISIRAIEKTMANC